MTPHGPAHDFAQHRTTLIVVLVIAAMLRMWGLVSFPFEQDELYTIVESTQLFHTTLKPGIGARPLYYLVEHVLLLVAPATELSLRLLPFVFGLAGVAATWVCAFRLFGPVAAWVAGILAAISPWLVYTSGFARYWSLVYVLAAVFYLALALAYEHERKRDYVVAAAAAILGSLAHPTFVFAAAGAALGVTVIRRNGDFGWRWPSVRAWTHLWLPWLGVLGALYVALRVTGQGGALQNFAGRGMLPVIRLVPAMLQWMTPMVFAAGMLGAAVLLGRRADPLSRRFGAMVVLGCGSALMLLVGSALRTDVYADYGLAMLPLLLVGSGALIAAGADRSGASGRFVAGSSVVVLLVGTLPYTLSHLSDGTRFDYRPALRLVEAIAPATPVLAWPLIVSRHYAPQLDTRELRLDVHALDSALAETGDLWVVLSRREYGLVGDLTGAGGAWIDRHCRRVASNRRERFDSRRYEVELDRCQADH